jgi:hypothetical protein
VFAALGPKGMDGFTPRMPLDGRMLEDHPDDLRGRLAVLDPAMRQAWERQGAWVSRHGAAQGARPPA